MTMRLLLSKMWSRWSSLRDKTFHILERSPQNFSGQRTNLVGLTRTPHNSILWVIYLKHHLLFLLWHTHFDFSILLYFYSYKSWLLWVRTKKTKQLVWRPTIEEYLEKCTWSFWNTQVPVTIAHLAQGIVAPHLRSIKQML